jgi:hypothetical protein
VAARLVFVWACSIGNLYRINLCRFIIIIVTASSSVARLL